MTSITNKTRLETVLNGKIPDCPPHFELLFQLEKEMFGLDYKVVESKKHTERDLADALEEFNIEVKQRLIEELGWAAVPAWCFDERINRFNAIQNAKKHLGHSSLVFDFNGDGVFWMPTGGDIMDFVTMLFERPEEMHQKARQKCDSAKALARKQADAGVDFLIQNSDFGFNSGPFISPKHFNEFVTPYMAEFIDYVHQLGLQVILHSDGDLNELLEQIISTGVDGYQSIDPQGNMDIKLVRERFPDWILMGNVNCSMLQESNEPEICKSVKYCMDYGGIGRRYIFSTSNTIFKGMPSESYRIMLDAYEEYCKNRK